MSDGGGSIRRRPSRPTFALLVGVIAFAVTLAIGLMVFYGGFGVGSGTSDGDVPYASFEFEQREVTMADPDETDRLAVVVTHRSGMDLPQGNVAITVNGEAAWDVRESERGTEVVPPWNGTDDPVSETDARVLFYGEGAAENPPDAADDSAWLEEDDVVEIVWYADEDARMTVLQRYVVDGNDDDATAAFASPPAARPGDLASS